ncbi:RHS repeat domain-containing protein [Cellvibrio sp. PSBB006]|uniref:RHS repeat domain-containing protein n=1 Tax=Cellvibrio sp. PSBB006 TaxID=1987723 RepID=UPI000B3B2326|nr:RHS repeat-associated core domain-containing protein [Cellvibrio sp. PSBB006]ARU26092.1 hypothetical protein CBR65_00825 [Cellvibrio sp. PSBB006]
MKTLHFIVITCLLMFATSASAVEQITFYHNDAAGSPIAATDDSGNLLWDQAYDAWGVPIPSPSGDPRGFTGASRDSDTRLSDLQARWYSPELGRMLAMDPVSFHEGNIQSFNLYAYGNNNPYRYDDPNGESPKEFLFETVPAFGQSMYAMGQVFVGLATNDWAMYYAGGDRLRELQSSNIDALVSGVSPPLVGDAFKLARNADKIQDRLPDNALVCRGGTCTADRFASGSGVKTDAAGKLDGVSVNSASGRTLEDLTVGIPHPQVGVTTVGDVRRAGGDVVPSPTRNNPYHATMKGITPQQAQDLMTPTKKNPHKR